MHGSCNLQRRPKYRNCLYENQTRPPFCVLYDTVYLDGHKGDVVAAAWEFAPDGFDVALLTAGGEVANQALATVRDGGRVAYPNGVMPLPKSRSELRPQSYDVMPNAQLFKKLNQLIESGPFEVHVARIFSLEQAAEAHRTLDQHYLGKLALRPS